MDQSKLGSIGLWEDDGEIIGMVTYEEFPGGAYFIVDDGYADLKADMLQYAMEHLTHEGSLKALIPDIDAEFGRICREAGFHPTHEREENSVLFITPGSLEYSLPDGFTITSLAETYDLTRYHRVMWNGFNHEGDPPDTEEAMEERRISLSGPHNDLSLKIAVVAPDGNFASYCGMWYEEGTGYALVEPVATHPAYRRMGCGRAAVLEGISRCARRGADRAYVGSDQMFYYKIGFNPLPASTFWLKDGL